MIGDYVIFERNYEKKYSEGTLPTLNSLVQETMISTLEKNNAGETADLLDYTYGSKPFVNMECVPYTQTQPLRNSAPEGGIAFINSKNSVDTINPGYGGPFVWVRPACWVKLPE